MSKVKNINHSQVVPEPIVPETGSLATVPVAPAAPIKMSEEDRMALELAKSRRETVLALAKEALAKNETAELAYKYVVLQIYMKYGLTQADAISENGDIVRGGAVQSSPQVK